MNTSEAITMLRATRGELAKEVDRRRAELEAYEQKLIHLEGSISILMETSGAPRAPRKPRSSRRGRKSPIKRRGLSMRAVEMVYAKGEMTAAAICKSLEEEGMLPITAPNLTLTLRLYLEHPKHLGVMEVEKIHGKPTHWVYRKPGFVAQKTNGHDLGITTGGFAG